MSHLPITGEKKPCVLEMAAGPTQGAEASHEPRPCALLCADTPIDSVSAPAAPTPPPAPARTPTPSAPPEDESADPVGDGHSDAEWAERHPEGR